MSVRIPVPNVDMRWFYHQFTREEEFALGLVYSASQVKAFLECPRKWAWDKLEKVPRRNTKGTALGTGVHHQLEAYLTTGYMDLTTIEGKIAVVGLHHNPPPGWPNMVVEGRFELRLGPHLFHGYKDVEIITPHQVPYVQDHKSTKSFNFQLTPAQLPEDEQCALYAVDAMAKANTDVCDVNWVYYKTQGRKESTKTHLRIHRDTIRPALDRCVEAASKIRACRLTPGLRAKDLPPNVDACGNYGGCQYMLLCDDLGYERYFQG